MTKSPRAVHRILLLSAHAL